MGKFLLMPKLDMSMKHGIIMQWLISEGDTLEIGDYFAEVETGKVLIEIENTELTGTVLKKYFEVGDTIDVNRPIMYVGEKGETPPTYEEALNYKLFEDVLTDKDIRQSDDLKFNNGNQEEENILVANKVEKESKEIINQGNITPYISDMDTTESNIIELENESITDDSIVIETCVTKKEHNYDIDESVNLYSYEEMQDIPPSTKNLLIIGGGTVAIETASVFSRQGCSVSIITSEESLLLDCDNEIEKALISHLEKQGISIYTKAELSTVREKKATLSDATTLEVSALYFPTLFTSSRTKTLEQDCPTNDGAINLNSRCIFTPPQLAWVGLSEEDAKKKGLPVKIYKSDSSTEKSIISTEHTLIKVVIDSRWDEILGVHIMGDKAVDIIARAVNAMKSEVSATKFLENYL